MSPWDALCCGILSAARTLRKGIHTACRQGFARFLHCLSDRPRSVWSWPWSGKPSLHNFSWASNEMPNLFRTYCNWRALVLTRASTCLWCKCTIVFVWWGNNEMSRCWLSVGEKLGQKLVMALWNSCSIVCTDPHQGAVARDRCDVGLFGRELNLSDSILCFLYISSHLCSLISPIPSLFVQLLLAFGSPSPRTVLGAW